MRLGMNSIAPLLAAGVAAVAIASAPIAAAAPKAPGHQSPGHQSSGQQSQSQLSCVDMGGTSSQCTSPGNAQVNDAPPQVDYFPYAGGAT